MSSSRKPNPFALSVFVFCLDLSSGVELAQNIISTIAGGGPTPTNPLQADLPGPTAAVRDQAGNTYIATPVSASLYKLTTGGTFLLFAGQGWGGFGGDGGAASAAILGDPAAIAFDSQGNMFVADFGNSRVRRVDGSTGVVTTVAGSGEKCAESDNTCGDGGPAANANLNLPMAVAVDSSGNIFIADATDNRIRRVDATTGTITTVVGTVPNDNSGNNRCPNPSDPCGDGGPATAARLNFPQGIAVDGAGNLYVSDTLDQRVRIVNSSGTISAFAGNGGFCRVSTNSCGDGHPATLANLHKPQLLALDSSNNLYIADTADHRIRVVSATDGTIDTVAGTGAQGSSGDGGSATNAALNLPAGVSVDHNGNILIADSGNQRVRIVNSSGNIQTLAGGGSGGDGGAAASATLASPYAVAEDSAGNLYIADTANNRIRKISGGTITTVAGTGNLCTWSATSTCGDGGTATLAGLNGPTSVAVDGAGNIYFSDTGNLIVRKVDTTGKVTTIAGNGNTCSPTNAACGDGGPATNANLSWPLTIALDSSNNIYIADWLGFRIRKVTGATISTFAGSGNLGGAGDGGLATAAKLNHPSSVTVDSNGNVYISDQYNNKVRYVNTSGIINRYALNGSTCLCGDGGPALKGSMWNPLQVSMDPFNNLFIAGGNANVVQRVDSVTGTWGTVAGQASSPGIGGFAGDGGLATSARMSNFGLVVDAQSNLYIADGGNNRIRTVHLTPAVSVPGQPLNFGNVPLNTQSAPKTVNIQSIGGVDLVINDISSTGANHSNFAITNNTCGSSPVSLGVDTRCQVSVAFTPNTYGRFTATLRFTDNAPNSPQTVNLSGSGPDFSISATAVTVNRGSSGNSTVTLTPIAGFNQTINLSCLGAPLGTQCSIQPSITLDGVNQGVANATIKTLGSAAPGTYNLTVRGGFPPIQHPATITLTVK